MKRFCLIFCIVMATQCFFMNTAENVPVKTDEPLYAAVQAVGAENDAMHIVAWGKLESNPDQPLSDELGQKLLAGLDIKEFQVKSILNENREEIELVGSSKNKQAIIKLYRYIIDLKGDGKVFFQVDFVDNYPIEKRTEAEKWKIRRIIQKFPASFTISTCLKGHLDGKLKGKEWAQCLQDGFDSVGAKINRTLLTHDYGSYSGFLPNLPYSLKLDGDEINFHLVMRYNNVTGKTEVIAASPIIPVDY